MQSPFPKSVYNRNAEIYKILANPIRLEILNSIKYQRLSVEQLVEILKLRKANVSQHLAMLRHAKLVTCRREGLSVYYEIVDPRIVEPCRILKELWEETPTLPAHLSLRKEHHSLFSPSISMKEL